MARATTGAHGHAGTTTATWERTLEDITIRDADGKVVQQMNRCRTTAAGRAHKRKTEDTCHRVARAVDENLGMRLRVDLPAPLIEATPKGAFAGVQQTNADFYQGQTVYGQGTAFPDEGLGQRPVPALQLTVFNDGA